MKKAFILSEKVILKDYLSLSEIIKTYKIPEGFKLNIKEYMINTNISFIEEIGLILRINDMKVISIKTIDKDSIPLLLDEKIPLMISGKSNELFKLEMVLPKKIDEQTVSLTPNVETITPLWFKIFLFGELNNE